MDVEGKSSGIETGVVRLLGDWGMQPVTYAGGVHGFEDLRTLKKLGRDRVHVTVGSALDLFGGTMRFEEVLRECSRGREVPDPQSRSGKSTCAAANKAACLHCHKRHTDKSLYWKPHR